LCFLLAPDICVVKGAAVTAPVASAFDAISAAEFDEASQEDDSPLHISVGTGKQFIIIMTGLLACYLVTKLYIHFFRYKSHSLIFFFD